MAAIDNMHEELVRNRYYHFKRYGLGSGALRVSGATRAGVIRACLHLSHVILAHRYNDVLEGRELVSYLVAGRTCLSRAEAQQVGRALQRCGVLMHVTQEHNFHDMGYFYRFDTERWRELRNR